MSQLLHRVGWPDLQSPYDLVGLHELMARTAGDGALSVAAIDGPVWVGHPHFAGASMRVLPAGEGIAGCLSSDARTCGHGTFVAGMLAARRDSPAPGICPGCTLIVRPIIHDDSGDGGNEPAVDPHTLAAAIVECVEAGALILNLSLATTSTSALTTRRVTEALDYAHRRGAITVAAAGNDGGLRSSVVTRHPGVVPAVACDETGQPTPYSNVGRFPALQGVAVPVSGILGLTAAGVGFGSGGTSLAAPIVSGTIALLWSLFPDASATEIRAALARRSGRPSSAVTPLLDARSAYSTLASRRIRIVSTEREGGVDEPAGGDAPSAAPVEPPAAFDLPRPASVDRVVLQHCGLPGCGVLGVHDHVAPQLAAPPDALGYVYALGRIVTRFPSLGVEKEFAQAVGRGETADLTDRGMVRSVLGDPENRYLARMLCWILTIEGLDSYLLQPRDRADFDLLVEALRPAPMVSDVDVVVGVRGPIAPPSVCNGLTVPILVFDQLYSFDRLTFARAIASGDEVEAAALSLVAEEVLDRILQLADNTGATDEHRALNYLAVRYPAIYMETAKRYAGEESLSGVEVRRSPMSGVRNIVDVIFSYTTRRTDVTSKLFTRVDVTEEFPFLFTKLGPYFDR